MMYLKKSFIGNVIGVIYLFISVILMNLVALQLFNNGVNELLIIGISLSIIIVCRYIYTHWIKQMFIKEYKIKKRF